MIFKILYFNFVIMAISGLEVKKSDKTLVVIAVTTELTDGYFLYIRSLDVYGFQNQRILAVGQNYTGHDLKINLLRDEVENYKDRDDVIIIFTDSYDVLFIAGEKEILEAFESFNASIVFSAESNCWPNPYLEKSYPEVKIGYRFLNSGGIIGYAKALYDFLPLNIPRNFDDQLYYTYTYVNEKYRAFYNIVLDTQAKIFQSLHNAEDHVSFVYTDDDVKLLNHYTNTTPSVLHGNGNGKPLLHIYSSYLVKSWTPSKGCLSCDEKKLDLSNITNAGYPLVLMGIFIDRPTPFIELKLQRIANLNYPKKRIFLFVYNKIHEHDDTVRQWMTENQNNYTEFNYVLSPVKNISIGEARHIAMKTCAYISCDIYFNVDGTVSIENPDTLKILISYKKTVLAPMMTEPGTLKSTFWGSMTEDVYYRYIETFDYRNILNYTRRGIWCVPQVWHIFVMKNYMLDNPDYPSAIRTLDVHPDISISLITKLSKKVSMLLYVMNLHYYGHLSNMEHVTFDHLHNDLWQVKSNTRDWKKVYLHSHFKDELETGTYVKKKCPNVYMLPFFSEEFCKHIIETIENVQTNDKTVTYFNQIGYEKEWNFIATNFFKPLIAKIYKTTLNKDKHELGFVLRHSKDDTEDISPPANIHYTINIALNYQGGTINFLPKGCSISDLPIGWAVLQHGKSSQRYEYHRPNVNGTRYNIISYIGT